MSTSIHVSKKLEKLIKKLIIPADAKEKAEVLGKWNATVFYFNRTKNWLLYNPKTHYSLILENITARDLPNIREKIGHELHLQLAADGINLTREQVNWFLDGISFHSTDADRSATAHMNQILFDIECYLYGEFCHSLGQINAVINTRPFSLDGAGKYSNLSSPTEEMGKILRVYLTSD